MGLWMRRGFFCAFVILVCAQSSAAANLKSALRTYDQAEQARKTKHDAAAQKGYETAFKELTPFAQQGNAEAQFYLGKMYVLGQGVPKNREEAIKLFRSSADQGNADAQFFLGTIYFLPHKDIPQGLMWMRLSAEQGNQDAQLLLGQAYLQRLKEFPTDPVQADMWLRLAARNNLPFYQLQLETAERQMNAAQIAKGKALADAWKPKHDLRPDPKLISKAEPQATSTK